MKIVPKLRFTEFINEWQRDIILNRCSIKTGSKDTQDKVENGDYPFFVRSQKIERINSYSINGVAILTSGDGVGVGKNFHFINGKFDFHQRVYALFNFSSDTIAAFLFQVFKSQFYRRVYRLSAKNSVDSVRMNMISNMEIFFPSLPEQQKIAEFLSTVDKKIQALNKKKELLQSYKKGVMQKIFPTKGRQEPEIRFKQDDGSDYPEWVEKRLGEVCKFYDHLRKPLKEADRAKIQGHYPYYGASGVIDYVDDYLFNGEFVLLGEDGANIITRSSPLAFCISGKFWANNHAHVLQSNESNKFLAEALERINYEKYNTGTAQPKLNSKVCKSIELRMPSFEEQTKIANFLTTLDDKINVVTEQIDKMKAWKKGLLQQMFV